MNEKAKNNAARLIAVGLTIAALVTFMGFGAHAAAGVILGGVWNLASLWCLTRMLQAWLGPNPSQRRVIVWLLVKFPLLYAAIFLVFHTRIVSFQAFTAGFSVVLVGALAAILIRARQSMGAAKS